LGKSSLQQQDLRLKSRLRQQLKWAHHHQLEAQRLVIRHQPLDALPPGKCILASLLLVVELTAAGHWQILINFQFSDLWL